MVFNSFTFGVFFVVVLVLYWSVRGWNRRKTILLVSSYAFYAAWDPVFVVLLWVSTVTDWISAKKIASVDGIRSRRRWLMVSLFVNLGLLSYFKYGRFIFENVVALLNGIGVPYHPAAPGIVLPIGISFYTFQTLSYTIDVYRNSSKPGASIRDFALFVTFFPQLVSGPIVRAREFLPQCEAEKRWDARLFAWGLILLLIGLFEKNVLADGVFVEPVDAVFADLSGASRLDLLVGMFGFACQVFFDFAGYSLCAVGAALCLGFRLPDNFRWPLGALGFTDLWSRWHVTLSFWIRDYLYFPLGGSRRGELRTYVNLLGTMFVIGLWHGASWNCVLWGGINGVYLMVERGIMKLRGGRPFRNEGVIGFAGSVVTFILFSCTLVVFRAGTVSQGIIFVKRLWRGGVEGAAGLLPAPTPAYVLTFAGLTFLWHWRMRNSTLEDLYQRSAKPLRIAVLALMLYFLVTHRSADSAFIYFQF